MKEQDLREKFLRVEDETTFYWDGYYDQRMNDDEVLPHAEKCVQITLDYAREEAIGFSEWMHENTIKDGKFYTVILDVLQHNQTLEQCYEIYLTTKIK